MVIVGQDPYPTNRFATGIAFAIPGTPIDQWPTSLKIIAESIEKTYVGKPYVDYLAETLTPWVFQKVLLLNKSLTCAPGEPGSHEKEWDFFMRSLIASLSEQRPDLIYYFIGSKAAMLKKNLFASGAIFEDYHPSWVARQRKEGLEADMKGHWKAISDLYEEKNGYPLHWFIPF